MHMLLNEAEMEVVWFALRALMTDSNSWVLGDARHSVAVDLQARVDEVFPEPPENADDHSVTLPPNDGRSEP